MPDSSSAGKKSQEDLTFHSFLFSVDTNLMYQRWHRVMRAFAHE